MPHKLFTYKVINILVLAGIIFSPLRSLLLPHRAYARIQNHPQSFNFPPSSTQVPSCGTTTTSLATSIVTDPGIAPQASLGTDPSITSNTPTEISGTTDEAVVQNRQPFPESKTDPVSPLVTGPPSPPPSDPTPPTDPTPVLVDETSSESDSMSQPPETSSQQIDNTLFLPIVFLNGDGSTSPIKPNLDIGIASTLPITYGQIVTGSVLTAGDTISYTFTGRAGDIVLAAMSDNAFWFGPEIQLYSSDGTLITSKAGSAYVELTQTLTIDDEYTLLIGDDGNNNITNYYTFFLQKLNPPANITPINYGDVITGDITLSAKRDAYTFTGQAGDIVLLAMSDNDFWFGPEIRLYSSDGTLITSKAGDDYIELSQTLTIDDEYTLLIGDDGGTNTTGMYTLLLQKLNPLANITPISYGDLITGNITLPTQRDVYTFTGQTGDIVLLAMSDNDFWFGPEIRLYSSDGTLIISRTGGDYVELTQTLTIADEYTLLIGDDGGTNTTNQYTLLLQKLNPPVNVTPISYGDLITGNIALPAERDVYTFTGQVGDIVLLAMSDNDFWFGPEIRLYSSAGTLVTSKAIDGYLELTHILPADDVYTLLVGDNGGTNTANHYTLLLQKLNPPANIIPISYGDLTTDDIALSAERDVYTFTGQVGDIVLLAMSDNDFWFGPEIRLYSSDGTLITSKAGDDYIEVTHILPADDEYTLLIGDNGGTDTTNHYALYLQSLNNPGNAIPLFSGQTFTDSITATLDMDTYVFTADVDTFFYIEANRLSGGLDPELSLYDPFGDLSVSGWHDTNAVISGTIETAGTHTLLIGDHGGTETGTYSMTITLIGPKLLTLGNTQTEQIHTSEIQFYAVQVPNPGEQLLIDVTPSAGANQLWVEGRFGVVPFGGNYDLRTTSLTPNGAYELLIAPSQAGTYYFSVFGREVNPSPGSYQITARTVSRHLSNLTPKSGGNTGEVTLNLSGLGFVDGVQVALRGSGLPTLTADNVTIASATQLWADFDLNGATEAAYDLVVTWPGGSEEVLADIFNVTGGQGACVEAQILVPDTLRVRREYVMWIEYGNGGDANMPAPLFIISGSPDVVMRLSQDDPFTDQPLQILGVNFDQPAGILPPGASYRIPIYFKADSAGQINLKLDRMVADAIVIDWATLKTELQPDDLSAELWDVIWSNFTGHMGNTWAEYLAALDDQATYLAQYGQLTYEVPQLFSAILGRASGIYLRQTLAQSVDVRARTPGLPLSFSRQAFDPLHQRFTVGPLGRGWSHNFEFELTTPVTDTIAIRGPGGASRTFRRVSGGIWQSTAGDYGILQEIGGGAYQLREKDGQLWRFAADGKLTAIEDTNGNQLALSYTGDNLTQISHSNGQSLALQYNAQGRINQLTDHAGQVTSYSYNAGGDLLTSITAPGGVTTQYGYEPATGSAADYALTSITYPDNTHQYYAYDAQGRLAARWRDGNAERIDYTYDDLGTVSVADAFNAATILRLGLGSQPLEIEDPLGNQARFQYDANFNLTQLIQPDGSVYNLAYDSLGNPTQVTDALNYKTKTSHTTDLSRLDWLRNARGYLTDFQYDSNGNLTRITYPDSSVEIYGYDGDGNLTANTNRRGDTIDYTYNALGQVTRKDYSDGRAITYTYDTVGRLTTVTDISGTITIDYDSRGFMTRIEYPSGHWFTFQYNDAGRRTQRVGDDGYTLNYHYDAVGRLERLTDGSDAEIIRYEYDSAGRLSAERKGNGTYATYTYDAAGQLLSLVNYAPDDTVQSRFDYIYDATGNRTSMTTLDGVTTYDYDATGQLTGVTYPDGRYVTYQYDGVGNRVRMTDDGVVTHYTTNNLDQYTNAGGTAYGYDADGNMTSKTDATGTTTYDFDIENRLTGVTEPDSDTSTYTYDVLGNRISAGQNGVVTNYVHDPIGFVNVAAEHDAADSLVARYIYGFGLVSRIGSTATPAYYSFDGTGHTRQLSDAGGAVANSYDYNPFGIDLQTIETIPNPFQYVGRFGIMAEANGLSFMRARYYDSSSGRFIMLDPIGFTGGVNLYAYTKNSPIGYIDPLGLDPYPDIEARTYCGTSPPTVSYDTPKRTYGSALDELVRVHENQHVSDCSNSSFDTCDRETRAVSAEYEHIRRTGIQPPSSYYKDRSSKITDRSKCPPDTPPLEPPVPPSEGGDTKTPSVRAPKDPNEKAGLEGIGPQRLVSAEEELLYTVYFENVITATAPAQEVFVDDTLNPNLDWSSFQLLEFAFGDTIIAAPKDKSSHTTHLSIPDYRPTVNSTWQLDISAQIDYDTGAVNWTFRTLDPQTGELPLDALAGFLPPEDDTGRGQGYVSFLVKPKPDVAVGTVLSNQASIVFDTNDPIVTNVVTNTIGVLVPGSSIYLPIVTKND